VLPQSPSPRPRSPLVVPPPLCDAAHDLVVAACACSRWSAPRSSVWPAPPSTLPGWWALHCARCCGHDGSSSTLRHNIKSLIEGRGGGGTSRFASAVKSLIRSTSSSHVGEPNTFREEQPTGAKKFNSPLSLSSPAYQWCTHRLRAHARDLFQYMRTGKGSDVDVLG
jgi:hypothetical protein